MKSQNLSYLRIAAMSALFIGLLGFSIVVPVLADNKEQNNDNFIRVLIAFDKPVGANERALVRASGGKIKYSYTIVNAVAAQMPETALKGLARNPSITSIDIDDTVYAVDIELDNSWGVKHIESDDVHTAYNNKGTRVKIGIIDSGVNYYHPDLDANFDPLNRGYDFYYYDYDPMDVYGHGTHVAGTACAEDNNNGVLDDENGNPLYGVVGVAPECVLYSLRVLNENGVGYWSDIIAAVEWSTGVEMQIYDVFDDVWLTVQGEKMDVINLSLGKDRNPGGTVQQAFDNAEAQGVLIVAAAGNSGNPKGKGNNTIYPAKFDSVIAVAATDASDNRASFSSTGNEVEIAAPGVAVYSAWNDDTPYYGTANCNGPVIDLNSDGFPEGECYKYGSGTSMASPHVAGVAALIIAAGIIDENDDGNINDEVRAVLQSTAIDLGANGRDIQYGYGLVNAFSAVGSIGPTDLAPTATVTNPADGSVVSGSITITANATDDAGVVQVDFYIDDVLLGSDTTSPYEFSWDTTFETTEGSHTVSVTAIDTASQSATDSVMVIVDNVNNAPVAEAGPNQSAYTGDVVNFDGSDSTDDRGIVSYDWDFGDGETTSGVTVSHAYASAGTYIVTLMITDADGLSDSDTTTVVVEDPPAEATVAVVDSIIYATDGGRNQDKHLLITVALIDNLGNVVSGASVSIDLFRDESFVASGTGTTGSDGTVTFSLKNAQSGLYETIITSVNATGLTWDGVTPTN